MKRLLQTLVLSLAAFLVPLTASAAYVQLADGVYQDGSTLYIVSGVTSLGALQINPSVIYCYAVTPPACLSNTFVGYDATLHVPTSSMVSYFTAQYWYNFNNVKADAVEPQSVTMNTTSAEVEMGSQLSLQATVTPSNATPKTVYWSSTDASVATVNSSGVVTAVGGGECYIRATCVDKQAFCHVTVLPERVTITLDQHEARLLPNHTMTLTATCSPATTDLVVTSSDPTVAMPRYVNGTIMVVGVSEGTAAITVSTADGWCNPDTCQVTVYTKKGDVNSDGFINIDDVTALINYLLTDDATGVNMTNVDTNQDEQINITDVTTLINYLLTDLWPWDVFGNETFTVNGVSFKMVTVVGDTFTMGATAEQGSDANNYEKPAHQVTLSNYSIGETEVTQALWQAVMGSNSSYFSPANGYTQNLQRPIEYVSWNDCQLFITKLNQMTGKKFRLPTEAEWEYAARGGNKSNGYKYSGSDNVSAVAWYWDNIPSQSSSTEGYGTQPVATKSSNELGIKDMSGNVMEWCQDWYGAYSSEAQTNPVGPVSGSNHVLRGGSWGHVAAYSRVSYRYGSPGDNSRYSGFRLALDVENSPKFRLSETVLVLVEGGIATVDIINGSGNYSVAGGLNCANSVIDGETLSVLANTVGSTTVQVTDNNTGATTVLTVIVNENFNDETFTVNGVSFKMVAVEGGTFTMGATAEQGDDAYDNEKPAHQVTLSSYSIGETEVTQELWVAVMDSNPSGFIGNLQSPVEQVSWNDCQEFITKLNQMTGRSFRLPTEAEWEYAARGGNKSLGYKYAGSSNVDDVAWYWVNIPSHTDETEGYGTQPVATKSPNELGLYDMSGNVWEWCQDWYGDYTSDAQTNPTGPSSGSIRVVRGGSWYSSAWDCRVSFRDGGDPSFTYDILGLRLAL